MKSDLMYLPVFSTNSSISVPRRRKRSPMADLSISRESSSLSERRLKTEFITTNQVIPSDPIGLDQSRPRDGEKNKSTVSQFVRQEITSYDVRNILKRERETIDFFAIANFGRGSPALPVALHSLQEVNTPFKPEVSSIDQTLPHYGAYCS